VVEYLRVFRHVGVFCDVTQESVATGVTIMAATTGVLKGRIEQSVGSSTGSDKLREPGRTDRVEGKVMRDARAKSQHRRAEIARPPSEEPSQQNDRQISYQCPVCGNALPYLAALPPFDAPCCECGSHLWCRRRDSAAGVVLEAVSGRAPEPREVERFVDSLGRHGTFDRVILDLSKLAVINSSFLAALVVMKKRVHVFGGTLFLCGLRPLVREIFDRTRLNRIFNIVESEEDFGAIV
jgi:anti-anti-sigma factor